MSLSNATPGAPAAGTPAVLHLICGKIGSGKSTLGKHLADQHASVLISEDAWLACLYPNEIHSLADYVRCAGRLREAMAGHVVALLTSGSSVVLDFPANTLATRAWGRSIFEKAASAHRLHFLDTPDAVCKARLRARNLAGEHPFQTTDAQFDQISSYFVAPQADEGFDLVHHRAS